jgi:hypothetical protein
MGSRGQALADFLRHAQCTLKLHTGPFRYEDDRTCVKVRRCARCGNVDSYPAHDYGPWVEYPQECRRIRTCGRCSAAIAEAAHSYTWRSVPGSPHPCLFQESCTYCGRTHPFGPRYFHIWEAGGSAARATARSGGARDAAPFREGRLPRATLRARVLHARSTACPISTTVLTVPRTVPTRMSTGTTPGPPRNGGRRTLSTAGMAGTTERQRPSCAR